VRRGSNLTTAKIFIVSNEIQLKIWKKIKPDYQVITTLGFMKRILEFISIQFEKSIISDRTRKLVLLSLLPKTNLNIEILENFLTLLDTIYLNENNELLDQGKEMSENQQKLFLMFRELFSKWQEYLLQNNSLDEIQFLKESIEKIKNSSYEKSVKLFPANTTIELHDSVNKIFPEIRQILYSFSHE
jgi:hypothetical protein